MFSGLRLIAYRPATEKGLNQKIRGTIQLLGCPPSANLTEAAPSRPRVSVRAFAEDQVSDSARRCLHVSVSLRNQVNVTVKHTVCPAASPQLIPTLKPATVGSLL